jgi:GT2 family glycosyltransferase
MKIEQALARSRRLVQRTSARLRVADDPTGTDDTTDPGHDEDDDAVVALLVSSPLFDPDWYASIAGCSAAPDRAARHYLRHARRRGLWPHPLFVPERVAGRAATRIGEADPLVAYLQQRLFDVSPHPLFEVGGYLRAHPEAGQHDHGPLAHYVEHGAAAGWAPNRWYRPRPEHPRGLADWSAERWSEWAARRSAMPRERVAELESLGRDDLLVHADLAGTPAPQGARVSVVVEARHDLDELVTTLRSVVDQELPGTEAVVVTDGAIPELEERLTAACPRLTFSLVRHESPRVSFGLNLAVERAGGGFLAWAVPGETWEPGRLRLLLDACLRDDVPLAYDSVRVRRAGKADVYAAAEPPSRARPTSLTTVDLGRSLVSRDAVLASGGFDETLAGGWEADLTFRLLASLEARHVPVVGGTRDLEAVERSRSLDPALLPVPDHATVPTWTDVAFNRHALDWDALGRREQRADVVSVVIPTHEDFRMTRASVATVMAADVPEGMTVECIVFDNGSGPLTSQVLDALGLQHDRLRVLHVPSNLGYALGNNLSLQLASGATVVFLNNDTKVDRGWLGPLVGQLADPGVLAAQSLLLYPSGTIQCAGIAFPDSGGLPYPFLNAFPVEDADGVDALSFSALTGAALAMRWSDVVALRGFDPLFRNGMEDVDLCLRLGRLRPGRFVVSPDSRVTHLESRTPGRFAKVVRNRRLFLDRWRDAAPRDDARLWAQRGFEVVDHVVRNVIDEDRRLCVPEPVLVRARATVTECTPRLRWSLKNPATTGEWGDAWGDTHFARCLAEALRELGQEVVIDRRDEFYRRTGHLDDVVLALRGRTEFQPAYGQINLAWVISHPEMLSRHEATSYDRVLAASESWSKRMSELWGIHIDPLMQATDPGRFSPGRAAPDTGHRVLFVGGSRGARRQMVQDAIDADLPLAVYGSQWEEFIPARYVRGEFVPNDQLSAMYAAAGVVLNDHWHDMRVDGFLSNRLFDAAASGARVVTDDVTGLNGLFGSSVQVVRDATELADLVGTADLDRVFGGPDERREVALRVQREHSFVTRARRLLDVALEVRSEQERRR